MTRARVWVERLKRSLSVEHSIAAAELRAVRKYLASLSPLPARRPAFVTCTRTCCAIRVDTLLRTRAPTCAQCRTTWAIATRHDRALYSRIVAPFEGSKLPYRLPVQCRSS
jgi:hypothetical protein